MDGVPISRGKPWTEMPDFLKPYQGNTSSPRRRTSHETFGDKKNNLGSSSIFFHPNRNGRGDNWSCDKSDQRSVKRRTVEGQIHHHHSWSFRFFVESSHEDYNRQNRGKASLRYRASPLRSRRGFGTIHRILSTLTGEPSTPGGRSGFHLHLSYRDDTATV